MDWGAKNASEPSELVTKQPKSDLRICTRKQWMLKSWSAVSTQHSRRYCQGSLDPKSSLPLVLVFQQPRIQVTTLLKHSIHVKENL